ncbi:MAG: hypothetical protein QW764_00670 [Desulfurococcaceae archaeon]
MSSGVIMVVKIVVRGRNNYERFTLFSWVLEIKGIIEQETGEPVEVAVVDAECEEPELYVEGYYVGSGLPGEEGYLIEIIKSALIRIRGSQTFEHVQ